MTRRISRRRYVCAVSALGLAATAGCADAGPGDGEDENGTDPESDQPDEGDNGAPSEEDTSEEESIDHENADGDVRFVAPDDGAVVSSPVEIELETEDFGLVPAEERPPEADETGETPENETGAAEADETGETPENETGAAEADETGEEVEDQEEDETENNETTEDSPHPEPVEGQGHLHVIVDEEYVEPGQQIPFQEGYHHLGDGESDVTLELEPGEYDLYAQAGDNAHVAYDLTDEITIEVRDENGADGSENESGDNGSEDDGEGG